MSNYPGFYYYHPQVSCGSCMDDHDIYGAYPDCAKCRERNKIKVELLQLSSRTFTHKAIDPVRKVCELPGFTPAEEDALQSLLM